MPSIFGLFQACCHGGRSWSRFTPLHLPNPNSGIDAVSLSDGSQLLVYNPLLAGKEWWQGRSVLKLAWSRDGLHWRDLATLEEHQEGEYSYPAILQDENGCIRIVYTDKRKRIKYVDFLIVQPKKHSH